MEKKIFIFQGRDYLRKIKKRASEFNQYKMLWPLENLYSTYKYKMMINTI